MLNYNDILQAAEENTPVPRNEFIQAIEAAKYIYKRGNEVVYSYMRSEGDSKYNYSQWDVFVGEAKLWLPIYKIRRKHLHMTVTLTEES